MGNAGFEKRADQCRDKSKKLRGDYRKLKENNTSEGNKQLKPDTCPPVVIDSSTDTRGNVTQLDS